MKHKIFSLLLVSAFALPNPAFALTSFSAILDPLNNSGVHGIANLTLDDKYKGRKPIEETKLQQVQTLV